MLCGHAAQALFCIARHALGVVEACAKSAQFPGKDHAHPRKSPGHARDLGTECIEVVA
jgi:hypothetical protein